jgi:beta-1,4-mannosyltransferase
MPLATVRPIAMATIAVFPRDGTPYTECLYREVSRDGIDIVEGDFSIRWLCRHLGTIDGFHFHWPSFAYAYRSNWRKTAANLARFLLFLGIIRTRGRRIFWTAHNLYPHDRGAYGYVLIDRIVRRLIVRLSSAVFVHGATGASAVVREFPAAAAKIARIDHGHWVGYYKNDVARAEARARSGIAPTAFVFLFIGICKEYKNLPQLIAAFQRVGGEACLIIAGRFQDAGYRAEVARLAVAAGPAVRLVPRFIEDDELQVFLNASDTVVLPYTEILTSGAAMLALSFGKPVVAPKRGYLQDVIDDRCGVLYEPEAVDGLVTAMREVRARAFDRQAILEHALSYAWKPIADATCCVYLAAIGGFDPVGRAGTPAPDRMRLRA